MSAPKKDRAADAVACIVAATQGIPGICWATTTSRVEGQRAVCRLHSPLGFVLEDGADGFPVLIRVAKDAADLRDDFVALNGGHAQHLSPPMLETMERFRRRLHKLPGAKRVVAGDYAGSPDPVERHLGRAVQFNALLTVADPAALQELAAALEELAHNLGA